MRPRSLRQHSSTVVVVRVPDLHSALEWWCTTLPAHVTRVEQRGPLLAVVLRRHRRIRPEIVLIAGPGALETCEHEASAKLTQPTDPWGNPVPPQLLRS